MWQKAGWHNWKNKPSEYYYGRKKCGQIALFTENADYKNLDELATALRNKLPAEYQERNDLVFLVGAELASKANANIQGGHTFILKNNGMNNLYLSNYFGGMPSIIPPQFPKKCAVVTTLKKFKYLHTKNKLSPLYL